MLPFRLICWSLFGSCLAVPASEKAGVPGAETLVIKRGGTYTGTFRSTSPDKPCVRIDTDEPVVLRQCRLEGPGLLIDARNGGARLTVQNCIGVALAPTNDDEAPGRFLEINDATSLAVTNCELRQTSGIVVYKWQGNGSAGQTLRILRNKVYNITGRYRNGGGRKAHFVLLNQVLRVPNVEIAWNQVINEPDQSMVEDNINIHNSSGTPTSPIRIHNNFIRGAYPVPATADTFTGSGITTDGDGSSPLTCTAYVEAFQNQVVSTCNAAMNIAAGHHVRYYRNRMVSSSQLPDGRALRATYAATSVYNAYNKPRSVFFANKVDNNIIGFAKRGYNVPFANRHDLSTGHCPTCFANTHLPNPITLATENREWQIWLDKLSRSGTKVGPQTTAKPPALRPELG
ncbi:hypothetical protein [Hymenobacter latericus]|uniref:hypothetical protein n=1 Tax=Hymenobacter sp. YIM 151858-1 TaxID=2987688 RepID=UPI0022268DCB|nr:hypothetical protein [Hymenobacter sp. YIM 151858-1]UYZ60801.1 hypothetical protein OIS50_08355 [Hymenobacter sp. YIM 151858-1]